MNKKYRLILIYILPFIYIFSSGFFIGFSNPYYRANSSTTNGVDLVNNTGMLNNNLRGNNQYLLYDQASMENLENKTYPKKSLSIEMGYWQSLSLSLAVIVFSSLLSLCLNRYINVFRNR